MVSILYRKLLLLFFSCLISLNSYALIAQANENQTNWMTETWNGDESLYSNLRQKVENNLNQNKSEDAVRIKVKHYQRLTKMNRDNPQAQFQEAIALHIAMNLKTPGLSQNQLNAIASALRQAKSPRTYDWTRARYLIEKHINIYAKYKEVGERLLKRNRNDYDVKIVHLYSLDMRKVEERQPAIQYGNELVQAFPRNPRSHGALGDVYRRIWVSNNIDRSGPKVKWAGGKRDLASRKKALESFRKALQFLSPDTELRRTIERTIKAMEQGRY